ncbi:hypothetical protein MD588_09100 [Photobacterium sp. SDRW27]|uniref:hypothetical protein n=1 Tax=Photobacterium obscurum TaxID=2829490 RepID=UPI00224472D3|nr:hypothetical protein [Photobacterium obscurum]MCW8328965.1 hypothetical protein [Photobacterium obscurum]
MKTLKYFILTLLFSFSASTYAAKAEPVLNQPVPNTISTEQLVKKITKAGLVRGWQVQKEAKDQLTADIHVRSHYVAVNISLHDNSYDITYRDSKNMKYDEASGTIHRKYNGWVGNLNKDIQRELLSE